MEEAFYRPPAEFSSGEVNDLATLTNLNADILLKELQVRYNKDNIYTFVSDILVAVNPFKKLPIYGKEAMTLYNNKQRSEVPPHVYVISDACYNNLFKMKKNQCAVISGESGAGKTESAKLIINHIIDLCKSGAYGSNLEDQIIQVSPLLEAFGNAQTIMNDNSSRFGKYTRLLFDAQGGVMGVQLSEYLLEKSRVVEQHPGERNFHVFYYIFANPNVSKYFLDPSIKYSVLGGEFWEDNNAMYQQLMDAMNVVGFPAEEQDQFFRILATCIHLGNVNFEGEETASLKAESATSLANAANLLDVPVERLTESLLGINTVTRGEKIRRLYTTAQAYDCRDALSKALYGSLFGWIVNSVNEMLAPELHQKRLAGGRPGRAQAAAPSYEIGVLDIFGFENFKSNSFEQICINLAHEQLQYFFNRHTFTLELEAYVAEGVDGSKVSFRDNDPLIKMFLEKPIGVLSLLDEESMFPKATDVTFVEKLNQNFKDHQYFVQLLKSRGYPAFAIKHFAAEVEYNGTNFLEKNRDNLAGDIVDLMQDSGLSVVQDVFLGEILNTGQIRPRARQEGAPRVHRGKEVTAAAPANKVNRKTPTLSAQFKNSLAVLIERMNACYPHFVRCIKPNGQQQSNNFQEDMVRVQLSYTGVLEATRIRQEGYAWRPLFDEFVQRFKIIAFPVTKLHLVQDNARTAKKIIEAAGIDNYMVGNTRLFLKYYHNDQMEAALRKFYDNVILVQNAIRIMFARQQLRRLQERARMSAAERALAEQREAEERARLEAIKKEREAEEARRQEEERLRLAEQLRLEKEKAEAEARTAEQLRLAKEAEALKATADMQRAQAEASTHDKQRAAEEALLAKKRAEEEAELARKQREEALRLAEEALTRAEQTEVQMEQLALAAEEARKEKEQAEQEMHKQRLERQKSRKKRTEDAARVAEETKVKAELEAAAAEEARLAKEKADQEARLAENARQQQERLSREENEKRLMDKLSQMEEEALRAKKLAEEQAKAAEEAMQARQRAEEIARRAEAERQAEERLRQEEHETEEAEFRAADYKSPAFNLAARVASLTGSAIPAEVTIDNHVAKGWLLKVGQHRKNWKRRWFVMDLSSMTLQYFENEKAKKDKGSVSLDLILRCYSPADHKEKHLFIIETLQRTYFIQATSPEAMRAWVAAINVVPVFNEYSAQRA